MRSSATVRLGIAVGVTALVWILLGHGAIPWAVERAFDGEGPGFIRRFVLSQIDYPPRFTDRWPSYSWTLTLLILGCGGLIVLSTIPAFQEWLEARHGKAGSLKPSEALGKRRAILVQGFIGILLGASLFSTVTNIEVWPFSPYRMYATLQSDSYSLLRLYAIADSGRIELGEVDDAPPFDRPRFQSGMRRLLGESKECDWLGEVAPYGLAKYAELHPGQSGELGTLRGVQLRELTWKLDLQALSPLPVSENLVCEWTPAREAK